MKKHVQLLLVSSFLKSAQAACSGNTLYTPVIQTESCQDATCSNYRGYQSESTDGYECQAWNAQTPTVSQYTTTSHPNKGLDGNYCRNPDDSEGGLWCYTIGDPDSTTGGCSALTVTAAPYELQGHKQGSASVSYDISDDWLDTDPDNCSITYSLEKDDGTALEAGLAQQIRMVSSTIYFDESANGGYDGSTISGIRVKAITEFGTPQYKSVQVTDKCPSQIAELLAGKMAVGTDVYRSATDVRTSMSTYFEYNTGSSTTKDNCHLGAGTFTLVTDASGDDTPFTHSLVSIPSPSSQISAATWQFDQSGYTGGEDIVFAIKYTDWYVNNNPSARLYTTITLRDVCKTETITPFADGYTMAATPFNYDSPYTSGNYLTATNSLETDFPSSVDGNCQDYAPNFEKADGSALDESVSRYMRISNSGNVQVDEGMYFGGADETFSVCVQGEYAPKVCSSVTVTETCGKQTIGVYNSGVEICGVDDKCESYRGKQNKASDGQVCSQWQYGLINADDLAFNPSQNPNDGLDDNYCRNPGQSQSTAWCPILGGSPGDPKFKLCDPLAENAYTFEATKGHSGTFTSSTKPMDDFTNTNPNACPITFSIVDSDGADLVGSANQAAYTINGDGYVVVTEFAYGGGDQSLQVKAVTAFGTPVFKPLIITEVCMKQTLSDPTGPQGLSATFEGSGTIKTTDSMNTVFSNTNTDGCPVSITFIDMDTSQAVDPATIPYLTVDAEGYINVDQTTYPGGNVMYLLQAQTDFGTPAATTTFSITEICGKQTMTSSVESYTIEAARARTNAPDDCTMGSCIVKSDTVVADDLTNSRPSVCTPALSIVHSNGNDLSDQQQMMVYIDDSDGKISVSESMYAGVGGDISLQVMVKTAFETPLFIPLQIVEVCLASTVTVPADVYALEAVETGTNTVLSTVLSDDFTNSNPNGCPVTFSLKDSEGNELDADTQTYLSIDGDGKVSVNEANYSGGAVQNYRVYATTDYEAVYKELTLTEVCGKTTITAPSSKYTLLVQTSAGEMVTSSTLADDFTNSNPSACPAQQYNLLASADVALPVETQNWLTINSDGKIQVDETKYPGGDDVNVIVQVMPSWGPVINQDVTITQTCRIQTVAATSADAYALEAIETGMGTKGSTTRPPDDFTNSDETVCPITFSLVDSEGADIDDATAAFLSINPGGYIVLEEASYPGGPTLNLQVKALTDFNEAVYKPVTVTEICGKQTMAVSEVVAYAFEAVETFTGTHLSETKPMNDFTNSNAFGCPITFSLVDSDGNDIDRRTAGFLTINEDGFVAIDESQYPGGPTYNLQVKALTDYNEPVFKAITVTEICGKQTMTGSEVAYAFEAVETFTGTVLSKTKPFDDFTNSNAFACPITFSLVDSDGADIDEATAAFVSINDDGLVAINEPTYPGGADISLQVKAITDFNEAVYKPITITEICGKQTLSDTDSVYTFEAVRDFTGQHLSSTRPSEDVSNSNPSACPVTYSLVDSRGDPLEAEVAAFVSLNADGYIQVDEASYPGGEVVSVQVKAITDFGTPFYMSVTVTEICGRQSHTVTDIDKVYDLMVISGKPGLILSTTKPQDDITNNDPSVCPTTWSIVLPDGEALPEDLQNVISINADGYVQVDQMNFDGVNFSAQVKAINPVFNEPVFSEITVTRQWLCREQTRTVNGGNFEFQTENLISDSACVESCSTKWTTCSANSEQSCFTLSEKVTNLGEWDSTYKCATTDNESFDNFLVAFTSNVANIELTLNVLPDANQNEVISCMKQVPQPSANEDPSFAAQQANLEKTVNGFYSCLLLEDLLTDPYVEEELQLQAPEDGFCGPAHGATKDEYGEWVEGTQFLGCVYPLCCGFAVPKGSTDDIRISTCADQFVYSPERVAGYERTIGAAEWDFTCQNVDGANILFMAMNVLMLSMSVYMI